MNSGGAVDVEYWETLLKELQHQKVSLSPSLCMCLCCVLRICGGNSIYTAYVCAGRHSLLRLYLSHFLQLRTKVTRYYAERLEKKLSELEPEERELRRREIRKARERREQEKRSAQVSIPISSVLILDVDRASQIERGIENS